MSTYFYLRVPNKYVYFQEVYMLAYKIIKTLRHSIGDIHFPSALIGIPLIVYYHHLNRTAIHIKDQHVVFYT